MRGKKRIIGVCIILCVIYILCILMFFSYYVYSRQNSLLVYFVLSLIINVLIAIISAKKEARLISVLFTVITCNYFTCTVFVLLGHNLFAYPFYFDFVMLIFFYQAAMLTTGSWLIPIITYTVLPLFQNRPGKKQPDSMAGELHV
jgi:hypothetical protein